MGRFLEIFNYEFGVSWKGFPVQTEGQHNMCLLNTKTFAEIK